MEAHKPERRISRKRKYGMSGMRVFLGCSIFYAFIGLILLAAGVRQPFVVSLVPAGGIFLFLIISIPNHKRIIDKDYAWREYRRKKNGRKN